MSVGPRVPAHDRPLVAADVDALRRLLLVVLHDHPEGLAPYVGTWAADRLGAMFALKPTAPFDRPERPTWNGVRWECGRCRAVLDQDDFPAHRCPPQRESDGLCAVCHKPRRSNRECWGCETEGLPGAAL